MERPEEYREYAGECLTLAARSTSDDFRAMLVQMSELWLSLAEFAERAAQRADDISERETAMPWNLHS
jgi:hypothetical protein